jgi:hypothetical protein
LVFIGKYGERCYFLHPGYVSHLRETFKKNLEAASIPCLYAVEDYLELNDKWCTQHEATILSNNHKQTGPTHQHGSILHKPVPIPPLITKHGASFDHIRLIANYNNQTVYGVITASRWSGGTGPDIWIGIDAKHYETMVDAKDQLHTGYMTADETYAGFLNKEFGNLSNPNSIVWKFGSGASSQDSVRRLWSFVTSVLLGSKWSTDEDKIARSWQLVSSTSMYPIMTNEELKRYFVYLDTPVGKLSTPVGKLSVSTKNVDVYGSCLKLYWK